MKMQKRLFQYLFLFYISTNAIACKPEDNKNTEKIKYSDSLGGFCEKAIEIPYIAHSNLAADFNLLATQGINFKLFSNVFGETVESADFNADFKMGWNEEYLLIQYRYQDDVHYLSPSKWLFWNGDALAFFIAKDIENSRNVVQELYAYDTEEANLIRTYKYDFRKKNTYKNDINIISNAYKKDSSYYFEIAFPFASYDCKGKQGDEYKLQLVTYDYDSKADTGHISYPFSYIVGITYNPWAAKTIKLTKEAKKPKDLIVRAFWSDTDSIKFVLYGDEKYNDKKIVLRDKSIIYFDEKIKKNKTTLFSHSIKMPVINQNFKIPALFIDNEFIETVDLSLLPRKYIKTKPIRFEDVIRVFEKKDRLNPQTDSIVLFLGSSTFTKWENLEADFKEINAVNRAFGGSIAQDVNTHLERLVFNYKPRKIVYYEGDNDIYFKMTPKAFVDTCKQFVARVHARMPETEIVLISIKPSPSRKKLWTNMQKANTMLKEFAEKTENVRYIDVSKHMFDEKGNILTDIWENDRLHLNSKGYEIWYKVLKEEL